jgi:hypothetical protein
MTNEEAEIRAMALKAMMPVKEMESTQVRWVKCEERMPEKDGRYLCAMDLGGLNLHILRLGVWREDGIYGSPWPVAWLENVPEYLP